MRIAIDYDNTYTADEFLWYHFITMAQIGGHSVELVTMRYKTPVEEIPEHICRLFDNVEYTERKSKKSHMDSIGRPVDIWIDDMPNFIMQDAWAGD
ncbi:hypothetical protein [Burkholderia territorii]|uniref:hypothetical protein n=1 Tax=Burkholderia territorii TaxID=1503055 RepID=UPI000754A4DA|nr:hypothetical protein [Burkholderia territorii]